MVLYEFIAFGSSLGFDDLQSSKRERELAWSSAIKIFENLKII